MMQADDTDVRVQEAGPWHALVICSVGARGRRLVIALWRKRGPHDNEEVVLVHDHVRIREVAAEGQVVIHDAGVLPVHTIGTVVERHSGPVDLPLIIKTWLMACHRKL